jgi:hypothetical protein
MRTNWIIFCWSINQRENVGWYSKLDSIVIIGRVRHSSQHNRSFQRFSINSKRSEDNKTRRRSIHEWSIPKEDTTSDVWLLLSVGQEVMPVWSSWEIYTPSNLPNSRFHAYSKRKIHNLFTVDKYSKSWSSFPICSFQRATN